LPVLYNVNGTICGADEPIITPASRIYRYGDGFFESMKLANGHVLHFERHYRRIQRSAMLLGMVLDQRLRQDILLDAILETCKAADSRHGRIRLSILRDGNGLYAPETAAVCFIIEVQPWQEPLYAEPEPGIHLGDFTELTKNANYLSLVKTTSAILYVMGGLHARRHGFDDCVVYNDYGRVAETVSCNIFKVDGDKIITPPLSEYCLDGVMRSVVMEAAKAYGYEVFEQPIGQNDLIASDEIFLTSAVKGIRCVAKYQGKQFRYGVARMLSDLLNKAIPAPQA